MVPAVLCIRPNSARGTLKDLHFKVNTEWITFILNERKKEQRDVSEKQSAGFITLSVRAAIFNGFEELLEQNCRTAFGNYAGSVSQLTSSYTERTSEKSKETLQSSKCYCSFIYDALFVLHGLLTKVVFFPC